MRPDEHGALIGSTAPFLGSPHRRVCRTAARAPQDFELQVESSAASSDARQASSRGAEAQERRLRYSGARLAARHAAPLAARYADAPGCRAIQSLRLEGC